MCILYMRASLCEVTKLLFPTGRRSKGRSSVSVREANWRGKKLRYWTDSGDSHFLVVTLPADLSGTKSFFTLKSCCPVKFWWSVLNVKFHCLCHICADETTELTLCVMAEWPGTHQIHTSRSDNKIQTRRVLFLDVRASCAELVLCACLLWLAQRAEHMTAVSCTV